MNFQMTSSDSMVETDRQNRQGASILNAIAREIREKNVFLTHTDGPGYNDHSGDPDHNKSA